MKKIISNFPNEHLNLNPNYYHALLNSIIGQQISVLAAKSIKDRFFLLHKNITPKNVMNLDNKLFKKCGISKQKIQYVNNISYFFLKNKKFIKEIKQYDEIYIREKLIALRNWTSPRSMSSRLAG